MKKLLYLSLILLVVSFALPSCNKKLKKELEDLDNSVNDLKNKNAELEEQLATTNATVNNLEEALEASYPISWTFNGYYNATNTTALTFKHRLQLASKSDYQYISNSSGSDWNIYVEKAKDFAWTDYSYIDVLVNVSSKTLISGIIYGTEYAQVNGGAFVYASGYTASATHSLTANKIEVNTETGEVDIDLNWSNTVGDSFGYGTENGTISFKGTCYVYN